jgi:hypothetical protein
MKGIGYFIILLILIFPVYSEENQNVSYEEKIEISYLIYENFYPTPGEAVSQIKLMKSFGYKGLKVVKKKVEGEIRYAVFVAETKDIGEKNRIANQLRKNRFGSKIYQRKKTIKIPIKKVTEPQKEPVKEIIETKAKKKRLSDMKKRDKVRRKAIKKYRSRFKKEKIKEVTFSRKTSIYLSAAFTLISSGLSYYYYKKADGFYDDYMNETDPDKTLSYWDNVQVNDKKYKGFLVSGISAGGILVYQFFFRTKDFEKEKKVTFNLTNKGNILCLGLKLRY